MPHTRHALELTLWHRETRTDRALKNQTCAPDLHQFGRSGRRYTRDQRLNPSEKTATSSPRCAGSPPICGLPTLHIARVYPKNSAPTGTQWANRASLWDSTSCRWQLYFVPGTALTKAVAHNPANTS